jgi:prepilin-type N-terminal cleavage/methylation domain-containing protein
MRPLRRPAQPSGPLRADLRRAFTMAEMLVVMAIITILAASLAIVVPKIRTRAMRAAAGADIRLIGLALNELHEDMGRYPSKPYAPSNPDSPDDEDYIDYVLYRTLVDPNYPSDGAGWGGARTDWKFLHGDYADRQQILDPWGVPYYYIPHTDYLNGVRIKDSTDNTPLTIEESRPLPNYYGATPEANDFRGEPSGDDGQRVPRTGYFGPPPNLNVFYNATTFQLHSKGPDQKTDYYDDKPEVVDACDRGCDPDDINNYGGVIIESQSEE